MSWLDDKNKKNPLLFELIQLISEHTLIGYVILFHRFQSHILHDLTGADCNQLK